MYYIVPFSVLQFPHLQLSRLPRDDIIAVARPHPPSPGPTPQDPRLVALDHIAQNCRHYITGYRGNPRTVSRTSLLGLSASTG